MNRWPEVIILCIHIGPRVAEQCNQIACISIVEFAIVSLFIYEFLLRVNIYVYVKNHESSNLSVSSVLILWVAITHISH
jgi:hypothetical protein